MDNKDKLIAEILDINDSITPLERFLDDQHHCPLCGDELLLTHVTHFVDLKTKEDAHCDSCQIQIRHLEHSLQ